MNNTKWKEFVFEINLIEGYEPLVNIKLITDVNNNESYSPVWWEEVEMNGFDLIEWVKINPHKIERQGRLVSARTTDYTEFITSALEKHKIQFELSEGIITVYGYKRSIYPSS